MKSCYKKQNLEEKLDELKRYNKDIEASLSDMELDKIITIIKY